MDILLQHHSVLIRRLRVERSIVTVEDLEQYLDRILQFLKTVSYGSKKTNGLDLLTVVCDDLASAHMIQLFNHPVLIGHPVFICIGQTLEMLLTKSNHSQSIPMKKYEEDALLSISYLISQLCLHRNEYISSFYGRFSDQIHAVTSKPNMRDDTIGSSAPKMKDLTEKPNIKTARLYPRVSKARPLEENKIDLRMIPRPRKFPNRIMVAVRTPAVATEVKSASRMQSSPKDLPRKTYQDVLLTSTLLDKLRRGIDDLSQTDYSPFHVRYKVIDRLVRLCSKMNIADPLCDSIVKCLCSNMYYQVFATIEAGQVHLTPKQLFFICRCPQLIIRHDFSRHENISKLLCPVMITKTKIIIDQVLSDQVSSDGSQLGIEYKPPGFCSNQMRPVFILTRPDWKPKTRLASASDLSLQGLSLHLELLYHLSLTSLGRRYFVQSSIFNQIIRILHTQSLMDNACVSEEFFDVDVRIIAYALMILCNLAYEKTTFSLLKRTDFRQVYNKVNQAKESTIKFAYNALSMILSENEIDEGNEPMKLKQDCLQSLQDNIYEPKQIVTSSGSGSYKNKDQNTKYVFLTKMFVDTLCNDIQELSTTKYDSNAPKYKRVVQRVRVCTKQSTNEVDSLLTPIINCLSSKFYLHVFENIELAQTKMASGALLTNRTLAPKHIFFMRECPEFLIQHGHQRKGEVNDLLATKMLRNTITIFQQHLFILTRLDSRAETSRGQSEEKKDEACIEALSYHIKLLNYFAMQRSIRLEFLNTPIIEDIINVLQDQILLDQSGGMAGKKIDFIGQSLTLLYNLALEKQILHLIKSKNMVNTCAKLRHINDKIVQFISQILSATLDDTSCRDLREPNSLSKTCIEYLDKSVKVPKLCYHGIKLSCLLKNLKAIVKNDLFSENFVEDKYGIVAVTNCVSAFQEDDKKKIKGEDESVKVISQKTSSLAKKEQPDAKALERIQYLAIDIVWVLSFYGPTTINTLKLNDTFIDEVLKLCNGSVNKAKKVAESIIWRLGSEQLVRFEQTQKEEERARNRRDDTTDMMDRERLITTDQWDDSVPFDLLMSYSNNVNDKIISLKIADRLRQRRLRVYTEKQGKHRLELMEIAAAKQKPILACLSSKFRESKFCMAEVDHASKLKCPVIPVIVEENYTVKGWLNHILANRTAIKFTNKNFNESFLNLIVEIDEIKHSEERD